MFIVDKILCICETYLFPQHNVSGQPYFTQYDPRENEPRLKKYDTVLLQIVSQQGDEKDLIMIGDCGVLNFFIPKENLKRKDFSDILYTWDCG